MSDPAVSHRRRRWRTTLEALVLSIGIMLLLWGANTLARMGAESLLERNIQDVTGVAEPPEVELGGSVFLTQAIRGAYKEVRVSVVDIRSGPLQVRRVEATLYDVRMPFKDLLLRDIRRVAIGRSVDQVTLRFQDVNSYFEITGRSLRLAGTNDGRVRMTGFFNVLDQTVPVSAEVELSVDGTQLRITPRQLDTGNISLSPARRLLLDQRLNLTVPLDMLPFGRQLTGIAVEEDQLRLAAESTTIALPS